MTEIPCQVLLLMTEGVAGEMPQRGVVICDRVFLQPEAPLMQSLHLILEIWDRNGPRGKFN